MKNKDKSYCYIKIFLMHFVCDCHSYQVPGHRAAGPTLHFTQINYTGWVRKQVNPHNLKQQKGKQPQIENK